MAADGVAGAFFGWNVALDGDTVFIGAPGRLAALPGAVHVFTRSAGSWAPQAKLSGSPRFGEGVALIGNTAVVTSPIENRAHAFSRSATSWIEELVLTPPGDLPVWFGWSVAMHGSLVAVSDPDASPEAPGAGVVHIYRRDSGAEDSDGDGIPDSRDPSAVVDVVRSLPLEDFAAGGHATAIVSHLDEIEAAIAAGDIESAVTRLRNLLRHLDGCPAAPAVGESADLNDWITNCDTQRAARQAILGLIEALTEGSAT